ncbi:RibD family protein [Streptomyces xiamenensis]
MADLPYVLLSCAASVDGYIDDASEERLLLSNDEDFDRVDDVRATCDAILVGANTIRRDNPRLLVRSEARRRARVAAGRSESPVKVTISGTGDLSPEAKFFTTGAMDKLVYCDGGSVHKAADRLADVATVLNGGQPLELKRVLADLAERGVRRLMVEGGRALHTQFLRAGLADELHLVIAPFLVGDPAAPRFAGPGPFPQNAGNRMRLAETRQIGDCVLLRYLPGEGARS